MSMQWGMLGAGLQQQGVAVVLAWLHTEQHQALQYDNTIMLLVSLAAAKLVWGGGNRQTY